MLVSYDVVSLFTNIPLNETLDIVCNYVYQQHSPPKYSETFKKLLQIATGGYFLQRKTIRHLLVGPVEFHPSEKSSF